MPNYLRGSNPPEASLVNAETPVRPDEDSLQSAVTGTGNPIAFPPDGAQSGQPSVQGSVAPSQTGAKTITADRVPSGTLTLQSDAVAPTERISLAQRTFSRGPTTPRGAMDPNAAVPADTDIPGGSPAPPSTRGGTSAGASQGGSAPGVNSQAVVGSAAAGGASGGAAKDKKKASEMTKAERRAVQEEQRAKKSAKGPQGAVSPDCVYCCG